MADVSRGQNAEDVVEEALRDGVGSEPGPLAEVLGRRAAIEHALGDIALLVREQDGRILDANRAATETYGYDRTTLLGMTVWQLRAPETHSAIRSQLESAKMSGELFETTHLTRDGRRVLVEVRSHGCSYRGEQVLLSIVRDITERRRNEQMLCLLKHTIDQMTIPAFWQDADGRFVYVNAAACASLGYTPEELGQLRVGDVNPKATPEAMASLFGTLRSGRKETPRIESVLRRKDGTVFPVEITSAYVRLASDEYICGFARDLSDSRHAEDERRRLAEELRHAQKAQALGVVAAGLAHDLNNILTPIFANVEALTESLAPNSSERQLTDEVFAATARARDLVRRLLAFGRRISPRVEACDLTPVVTEALELMRRVIPSAIEIELVPPSGKATIAGDPHQLHQVVVNLLLNATDAIGGATGHIRIDIAAVELDETSTKVHPLAQKGRYVRLSVKDTGTGMDEETRSHIFEPFFTTKELGKGTGLGLSVVHGIATSHGGFVTVASQPGCGATFSVFIPASASSPPPGAEDSHISPVPVTTTRVLLVDDDEQVLRVITRILERHGLTVTAMQGAVEAAAVVTGAPNSFDVVLVDMTMPRMSGLDFAAVVTKANPGLGVVLMSGNVQTIDPRAARACGVTVIVEKPLRRAELLAALAEAASAGHGPAPDGQH